MNLFPVIRSCIFFLLSFISWYLLCKLLEDGGKGSFRRSRGEELHAWTGLCRQPSQPVSNGLDNNTNTGHVMSQRQHFCTQVSGAELCIRLRIGTTDIEYAVEMCVIWNTPPALQNKLRSNTTDSTRRCRKDHGWKMCLCFSPVAKFTH